LFYTTWFANDERCGGKDFYETEEREMLMAVKPMAPKKTPIGVGGAAPPNALPIPASKPFPKSMPKKGGKGK